MQPYTLVTGGAKRLGKEICLELARQGHLPLIHYRTSVNEADQLAKACQNLGAAAQVIQGDFSSAASTSEFIDRCQNEYGSLGHLVNNVGNYLIKSVLKTTIEEWTSLFQTNLHAPFMLAKAFASGLKQHQGCIINIGTHKLLGSTPNTYCSAYYLTKAALWNMTRMLASELAPEVRVNMVSPGFLENSVDKPKNYSESQSCRLGMCKEVARVAAFLLDTRSCYITGQNIEVAGSYGVR